MRNLAIIGLGGFIGAVLRYLVSGWVQQLGRDGAFPVGTLGVNVAGCLLIGLLGGLAENLGMLSDTARLLLIVGILGSFTTFSTFGYETLALLRDGQFGASLLNVALQVAAGLFAVWAGYALTLPGGKP